MLPPERGMEPHRHSREPHRHGHDGKRGGIFLHGFKSCARTQKKAVRQCEKWAWPVLVLHQDRDVATGIVDLLARKGQSDGLGCHCCGRRLTDGLLNGRIGFTTRLGPSSWGRAAAHRQASAVMCVVVSLDNLGASIQLAHAGLIFKPGVLGHRAGARAPGRARESRTSSAIWRANDTTTLSRRDLPTVHALVARHTGRLRGAHSRVRTVRAAAIARTPFQVAALAVVRLLFRWPLLPPDGASSPPRRLRPRASWAAAGGPAP